MARKKKTPVAAEGTIGHNGPAPLTDDQRQKLHFMHLKTIEQLTAEKDTAVAAIRLARKKAKSDLGDEGLEEIDVGLKLNTDKGEEKMRAAIERQIRVARWHGADIGDQLDILDTVPARDWRAEGKRTAMQGGAATIPDGLSQQDGQLWMAGWTVGNAVIIEKFTPAPDSDLNRPGVVESGPGGQDNVTGAEPDLAEADRIADEALKVRPPGIGDKPPSHIVKQ